MSAGYYDDLTTSDIIGARGGGDALSNVVKSILEQIMETKNLTSDSKNPDQLLSDWGVDWVTGKPASDDYGIWGGVTLGSRGTGIGASEHSDYNLENLLARLKEMYGEEGTLAESTTGYEHMKKFYNMLTDLDIGTRATGYHKDVSDISAEFGGQYSDLRNKLTGSVGKKGRYSSLTGKGKPKFTTDDYLSQWYGTKEKEQELYGTERENVLSDYNDEMLKLLDTYS